VVITDNPRGKSYGPSQRFLIEGNALTPMPPEDD
jgi:hypothetical protein